MAAKGYVQVNKPANRAEQNRYSAWERRQNAKANTSNSSKRKSLLQKCKRAQAARTLRDKFRGRGSSRVELTARIKIMASLAKLDGDQ